MPGIQPVGGVVEQISRSLLTLILNGSWGNGARLPAERELCGRLGASRASVREAMKRLELWGVVETRRSGAIVRSRSEWRLPVAAMLVQQTANADLRGRQLLAEMLELRRLVLCDMVPACAPRLRSTSLVPVREAIAEAGRAAGDYARFSTCELAAHRLLLEGAGLATPMWLLNTIAEALRFEAIASFQPYLPDNYVGEYARYLGFLEAGKAMDAGTVLSRYLNRHDRTVMRFFSEACEANELLSVGAFPIHSTIS